jgi:hypothetical protein
MTQSVARVPEGRNRYLTAGQESVQVTALVPVGVREHLRAVARKNDLGIQDYLRALIFRELGLDDTRIDSVNRAATPRRVVALPIMKSVPKPIAKPAAKAETPMGSVCDLIERGFTPQQIAAKLRMPYRDVLTIMGAEVDAHVQNKGEF